MDKSTGPHGLLLTGGTSRRMGEDKARSAVGGVPMGALAGKALLEAASPVLCVGPDPGLGLDTVEDDRRGPLAALAAGMRRLTDTGFAGPVLLVACDMPFLTAGLLALLARELGSAQAAVPLSGGRLQPLAACYAASVLPVAERLVAAGRLSMRSLMDEIDVHPVGPESWSRLAGPEALTDVDTPADLRAANEAVS
jgi:molybdopterin-guanine dinucleotide biosynthesis protein A